MTNLITEEDHYQNVAENAEDYVHAVRMSYHGPNTVQLLKTKKELFDAVDAMVIFMTDP